MTPGTVHNSQRGFTLLEILVVMGLLFVFMTFLTNILFTATDIFSESQRGTEITQRTLAAQRPVEECLRDMTGPTQLGDGGSDARLLVQWADAGLRQGHNRLQVLRSTVRVDRRTEMELLKRQAEIGFVAQYGEVEELQQDPRFKQALQQIMQQRGLRGRAQMLLLVWPQGDAEGAFLELRCGLFLPGESLPFKEADGRSLMGLREVRPPEFPAQRVLENTKVLASGILHLEYRLKSQYTTDWNLEPGSAGPEWVWDSARAGWFDETKTGREQFTMDLGAGSLNTGTDDVYPYWVRYTLVVGNRAGGLPDAILADAISEGSKEARLVNTDNLPDPDTSDHMLKIGSEWVGFGTIRGRTLKGLRRGLRGTKARSHLHGTGVRAGRMRVGHVRLLHGRDNWNG